MPWTYYSLCVEFSRYPHSLIYQNNSRCSGIFSCRRPFFAQFPKWGQLDADSVFMYIFMLQLNNLACSLAHVALSLLSAPLQTLFLSSGTPSRVLPSNLGLAPPAEFSGGYFFYFLKADCVFLRTVLRLSDSFCQVNCSVVMPW